MTRVALVADIHANDVALERVLEDIDATAAAAQIVSLGDVAATGPQPTQVVERLKARANTYVMGNADAYLLDPKPAGDDDFAVKVEDIDRWCASRLSASHLDFIASFHPTVAMELGGADLLAFHGSPKSYDDVILASTPDEDVEALLGGQRASMMAGGHTHFAMVRRFGESVIVNPGSVGMAYDRSHPVEAIRLAPWAEYALLDANGGRLSIELRRVAFDVDGYIDIVLASGMPHARWHAGGYGSGPRP
jgi:putative phosphoesterase